MAGNVRDLWFTTDKATGQKVKTDRHGKGKRWLARYRDESGKDQTQAFAKKVAATNWLADETSKMLRGDWLNPQAGRISLQAFYDDWSPNQVWLSNTRENADLALKCCTFKDMPLKSVRKSHVEAWVKTMSLTLAPTTIDTRMTIIRGALLAAVADRVIARDPSAGVVLPRKRKAAAAMVIPTAEVVGRLYDCAEPVKRPKSRPGFAAYVALCAFAGLRKGEALGVKVGDIDFLRKRVQVARQLQRAKKDDLDLGKNLVGAAGSVTVVVRPPKYASERIIYLPDGLVEILARHVEKHPPAEDGWLFHEDGKPWHDNLVDYRWRATRKDAKADEINLHHLRHFFASGLIHDSCDVVTVQEAMGHASATTTLNTYAHLWPKAEDRTRNAAAGLLASALGEQTGNKEAK